MSFLGHQGVAPDGAPSVWMRQTGALILAASVIVLLVRQAPSLETLRAVLVGNAALHAAMFPIEIVAWRNGIITRGSGIVANSVLHVAACAGFVFFATR